MRDIQPGKMPSVSIIDLKPGGKGGPGAGPGAEPADDNETSFTCPACGEKLVVETKPQEDIDDTTGPAGGGLG